MSILGRSQDKKPYIEVKDAIVARSGIYTYTRAEILARGHKPAQVKDYYKEFRPAAVIAAAAPLFDLVPVPNREHIDEEITADNFHEHASAMIGGPIEVVPMPDGINIGLKGRIAFFTKDAYDYYQAGNKETSADYISESVLVDNPEEVGYDLIVTKITSVNNVAITARGRGGQDVRIRDSMPSQIFDKAVGRKTMGVLSLLGIGKREELKFSAAVKDSITAIQKATTAEKRGEIVDGILGKINSITDTPERSLLVSVVRDSFEHADDVLANWPKAEQVIEGIYARAIDAEKAIAAKISDAGDGKKEDKKEKAEADGKEGDDDKKKEAESKDSAAAVMAQVDEKFAAFRAELPGLLDGAIKSALNLEAGKKPGQESHVADSSPVLELAPEADVSFVLDGTFGSRNF